jgi:hypothetical protein
VASHMPAPAAAIPALTDERMKTAIIKTLL